MPPTWPAITGSGSNTGSNISCDFALCIIWSDFYRAPKGTLWWLKKKLDGRKYYISTLAKLLLSPEKLCIMCEEKYIYFSAFASKCKVFRRDAIILRENTKFLKGNVILFENTKEFKYHFFLRSHIFCSITMSPYMLRIAKSKFFVFTQNSFKYAKQFVRWWL